MSIITVGQYCSYSGVDEASVDAEVLSIIINAAQDKIEKWCGRTFETATFTEYHDIEDNTTDFVYVDNPPIISITSVTDDAQDSGGGSTIAATSYTTDDSAGKISYDGAYFTKGEQALKIIYVGGYAAADIPDAVKLAMLQMTDHLWSNREQIGRTGHAIDGEQVSYDQAEIPAMIRSTIAAYRMISI